MADEASRVVWMSSKRWLLPRVPGPSEPQDLRNVPLEEVPDFTPTEDAGAVVLLTLAHSSAESLLATVGQLWDIAQGSRGKGSDAEREALAPLLRERHEGPFDRSGLADYTETLLLDAKAPWLVHRVEPLVDCPGRVVISDTALYFQPAPINNFAHLLGSGSSTAAAQGVLRWPLARISAVLRRRRLMREVGLEVRCLAQPGDVPAHSASVPSAVAAQTHAAASAAALAGNGLISHAQALGMTSEASISAAIPSQTRAGAGGAGSGALLGSAAPTRSAGTGEGGRAVLLTFERPSQRDAAYALLTAAVEYARKWRKGAGGGRPRAGARRHFAASGGDSSDSSDTDEDLAASPVRTAPPPPMLGQGNFEQVPARSMGRLDPEVKGQVEAAFLAWREGALSNYEYLCLLNSAADRSPLDLTQYPVFPWVLSNYTSSQLDLSDPENFRDLSKPIGALNSARLARFLERYEQMPRGEDAMEPPFMYGTHYSTPAYVLFFLLRAAPQHQLKLQAGKFDSPDRQFCSIAQTWAGVTGNGADIKELIHEFYDTSFLTGHAAWEAGSALGTAMPPSLSGTPAGTCGGVHCPGVFGVHPAAWLHNPNNLALGTRMDGSAIDSVELPPWAGGSAAAFVAGMRAALESEHVSANLHKWVDLVFGFKQQGREAELSVNVFHYLSYEGAVDMESVTDPARRVALQHQIAEFGQTPRQLFKNPHPGRVGPRLTRHVAPVDAAELGMGTPEASSSLAAAATSGEPPQPGATPAAAGAGEGVEKVDVEAPAPESVSSTSSAAPAATSDDEGEGGGGGGTTRSVSRRPARQAEGEEIDLPDSVEWWHSTLQDARWHARCGGSEVWTRVSPATGAFRVPPLVKGLPPRPTHGVVVPFEDEPEGGVACCHHGRVLWVGRVQHMDSGDRSVLSLGSDALAVLRREAPGDAQPGGASCVPLPLLAPTVPCLQACVNPNRHRVTAAAVASSCLLGEPGQCCFTGDVVGRVTSMAWIDPDCGDVAKAALLLHSFLPHPVRVTGLAVGCVPGEGGAQPLLLASSSAAGEVCIWGLARTPLQPSAVAAPGQSGGASSSAEQTAWGGQPEGGEGDEEAASHALIPMPAEQLRGVLERTGAVQLGTRPKVVTTSDEQPLRPLWSLSTAVSQLESAPSPQAVTCLAMAPPGTHCAFLEPIPLGAVDLTSLVRGGGAGQGTSRSGGSTSCFGVWGESNGTLVWFDALRGQALVAQDILAGRWEVSAPGFKEAWAEPAVRNPQQVAHGVQGIAFLPGDGGVVACTADGTVALFNCDCDLVCLTLLGVPAMALCVVHGSAGGLVAVACADGTVRLVQASALAAAGEDEQGRLPDGSGEEEEQAELWLPSVPAERVVVATLFAVPPAADTEAATAFPKPLVRDRKGHVQEGFVGSSSTGEASVDHHIHVHTPSGQPAFTSISATLTREAEGEGQYCLGITAGGVEGQVVEWKCIF